MDPLKDDTEPSALNAKVQDFLSAWADEVGEPTYAGRSGNGSLVTGYVHFALSDGGLRTLIVSQNGGAPKMEAWIDRSLSALEFSAFVADL